MSVQPKDLQRSFWLQNWGFVFFMVTMAVAIIGGIAVAVLRNLHD